MPEDDRLSSGFRLVKGSISQINRSTISVKTDAGRILKFPTGKWAKTMPQGHELLVVAGKRWHLYQNRLHIYQIFSTQTGTVFSRPISSSQTKAFIIFLYGLIGIIPILGPLIVSGTCLWMIYLYLPKTLYGEQYAKWQLAIGIGGILALWTTLAFAHPVALHITSGVVAASSLTLYYRFTSLLEDAVNRARERFTQSLGIVAPSIIKKHPVFILPTREWIAVESKASNF